MKFDKNWVPWKKSVRTIKKTGNLLHSSNGSNLISSNIKPMHQCFPRRLVVSLFSVFLEYPKHSCTTSNQREHYNCSQFNISTLHTSMYFFCHFAFKLMHSAIQVHSMNWCCAIVLSIVCKNFLFQRDKKVLKRGMKEKRFHEQANDRQIKL